MSTTTARSRFQRIALFGIAALLAAFAVPRVMALLPEPAPPAETAVPLAGDLLLDETLPATADGSLILDLTSEDVQVVVGASDAVRITIAGETDDARDFFERQRYIVQTADGVATLRANPLRRNGRQEYLRDPLQVIVTVPAQFNLEHDGGSGDLIVGDLVGERLSIDTGSGDVTLGALTYGEASIDTGSGDVFVQAINDAALSIDTGSGDVLVERSTGMAEVDTGSGDVRFDAHAGAFDANTGSGDVTANLTALDTTEVDTGSGDVALTLLGGADLEIESNGEVSVDDALAFTGQRDRGNLSGRLGDGGPNLKIDTGSGDVSLRAGTPASSK